MTVDSIAVRALLRHTSRLPMVVGFGGDPVATGLAASLRRPGGQVTGRSQQIESLGLTFSPKRLLRADEVIGRARPPSAARPGSGTAIAVPGVVGVAAGRAVSAGAAASRSAPPGRARADRRSPARVPR